jgi:hypothetical protein
MAHIYDRYDYMTQGFGSYASQLLTLQLWEEICDVSLVEGATRDKKDVTGGDGAVFSGYRTALDQ